MIREVRYDGSRWLRKWRWRVITRSWRGNTEHVEVHREGGAFSEGGASWRALTAEERIRSERNYAARRWGIRQGFHDKWTKC